MEDRSVRIMLLGVLVALVGVFFQASPDVDLLGLELIALIAGLILGVYGFFRKS